MLFFKLSCENMCLCWGTQIVPIVHPIICKNPIELKKAKLIRVSIKFQTFINTFAATVLVVWLSYASLTAFIPSLFSMFLYSDFALGVTSKLRFGMLFTLSNFWRKSVVSLTYEGIILTIGSRWRSTYLEIVLILQLTKLATGHLGFLVYWFSVMRKFLEFPVVLLQVFLKCFL